MVVALICGGGNGAHVCAGIAAAHPGVEARVITLYADEAERWTNAMIDHDFSVTLHHVKELSKLVAKPSMVTKDPAQAMEGADIIVFMVPAFAHGQYLEALKPYVKAGMILAGCPGQAGFEFAVRGSWGDLALKVSLMSFESLPWACRMTEFGRSAEVLGTKGSLSGSVLPSQPASQLDPTATLQKVLGASPNLETSGHLLGVTLMGTNGYLHPAIMYGKWHMWDGRPFSEPPLFYNGLDKNSAKLLSDISDEVVSIATAVMRQRPKVDLHNVIHILTWYRRCYADDITDNSSLFSCIQTNMAYQGLTHPCITTDDGKSMPNFSYRYLTEDIPYGLVVMRGIATIAGVTTPQMDKVITWAQKQLGKEYLLDGELKGRDIDSTRCPQRYGLHTLDTILGLA